MGRNEFCPSTVEIGSLHSPAFSRRSEVARGVVTTPSRDLDLRTVSQTVVDDYKFSDSSQYIWNLDFQWLCVCLLFFTGTPNGSVVYKRVIYMCTMCGPQTWIATFLLISSLKTSQKRGLSKRCRQTRAPKIPGPRCSAGVKIWKGLETSLRNPLAKGSDFCFSPFSEPPADARVSFGLSPGTSGGGCWRSLALVSGWSHSFRVVCPRGLGQNERRGRQKRNHPSITSFAPFMLCVALELNKNPSKLPGRLKAPFSRYVFCGFNNTCKTQVHLSFSVVLAGLNISFRWCGLRKSGRVLWTQPV